MGVGREGGGGRGYCDRGGGAEGVLECSVILTTVRCTQQIVILTTVEDRCAITYKFLILTAVQDRCIIN